MELRCPSGWSLCFACGKSLVRFPATVGTKTLAICRDPSEYVCFYEGCQKRQSFCTLPYTEHIHQQYFKHFTLSLSPLHPFPTRSLNTQESTAYFPPPHPFEENLPPSSLKWKPLFPSFFYAPKSAPPAQE